jgi:hypothetical protein
LSEILNATVDGSKETGFSRRRVIKGVAWSVPVILTTVAVPPASASPGPTQGTTVSAKLELVAGGTTLFKIGSGGNGKGNQRSGVCPSLIRITNTGTSLVTGVAAGHLVITPRAGAPVGVGIEPMPLAPFTAPQGFGLVNVFEGHFTYPNTAGISAGGSLDLPLTFNYQATNVNAVATYDVDLSVTLPTPVGMLSVRGEITVTF